jgi:circadian clock protein KaiB
MISNQAAHDDPLEPSPGLWCLRLYVAGGTEKSRAAIENLERLCHEHLPGQHRVEIVDLLDNPTRGKADRIVAVPTLVCLSPGPARRVIGDLSDEERTLSMLQIPVRTG